MKVVLTVTNGPHTGKSFAFEDHDNFIVGRGKYAHFRLRQKDQYFSRTHFMVEVNPPHCRIMDLDSSNGTFVNGTRVTTTDLFDGDVIAGGDTEIRVSIGVRSGSPQPGEPPVTKQRPVATRDREQSSLLPRPKEGSDLNSSPEDQESAVETLAETQDYLDPPAAASDEVEAPTAVPESSRRLLPADFEERIGRQPQPISGFQIVDELGRGAMGIVYLAISQRDGAVVALKVIKPAVAVAGNEVQRFLREAEILRGLKHPHIVSFRDIGDSRDRLFFSMDFVKGIDALKLLRTHSGPLPIPQAVELVCQILDALDYAHRAGFVHRDIKPANLLLSKRQGRLFVCVADFGLARTYQSSRLSGLTMMGDVGGTVAYMPPEQITNYRDAKPAADQYSAAATLYHFLSRRFIYDFPNRIDGQLSMILQQDAVPIRSRREDIPAELAEIIHRALCRDPRDRFANAAEMRGALLPFCRET